MRHFFEYLTRIFTLIVFVVILVCHVIDVDAQTISRLSGGNNAVTVGERVILEYQKSEKFNGRIQWQKSTDQKVWLSVDLAHSTQWKSYPLEQTTWFRVLQRMSPDDDDLTIISNEFKVEVIASQPQKGNKQPKKNDVAEVMAQGPCPNPTGGTLTATAQPAAICQGGQTQLNAEARIPFRLVCPVENPLNPAVWATTTGVLNTNCTASPAGGQTLWFDGPSNVVRIAETQPLNTTLGNYLNFWLKLGGADIPGCEPPDLPNERVFLEYSVDGVNWVQIDVYDYNGRFATWSQECVTIPPAAQSPNTRFRFRQPDNSGVGFDNWALDRTTIDIVVEPSAINYSWSGGPVSNQFIANPTANPTSTTTYTVTAQYGNVSMTASVTVTVSPPPTGGTLTGASTACAGSNNHTLNLTGQSGTISFWQESPGCTGNWSNINIVTPNFTPTVNQTTCYRVAVVTPGCQPAFSNSIELTVPSIGQINTNQHICRGGNLNTLNLAGTSCAVVRWERSDDRNCITNPQGVAWTTISNTTYNQNPGNLQDTACFRAVVSCNGCPPATTSQVVIDVDEPPTPGNITAQFNQVCAGDPGPLIKLNQYNRDIVRWEMSVPCNPNGPWTTLNPPYENEIATPAQGTPGQVCYRAIVKNGLCVEQPSPPFTITVVNCPNPPPIPVLLRDTLVCYNNNFLLQVVNLGNWRIARWEISTDNGTTWNGIQNTQATYNAQNITSRRCYRVLVSTQSNPLSQRYTNVACVRSTSPITGGVMQGGTIACSGNNQGCMNLVGHTQPPNGTILRWETRRWDPSIPGWENGGNWTTLNNVTTQLCYQNLTRATEWRAVISDGGCSTAVSFPARVDIDEVSVGGHVDGGTTICIGTNTTLTLTGRVGEVEEWQQQNNCTGNFTPIANTAFLDNYTTPNLNNRVCYRVKVKSGVCPSSLSDVATVDVTPLPNAGTLTQNRTICRGSSSGIMTLTGHTGPITRWERAFSDLGPWIVINNTTNTYEDPGIQNSTYYRVIVGSGACQVITNNVHINVDPPSIAGIVVLDGGDCVGSNALLRLTESTGTPVRWEHSANCTGNWTTVVQTTTTFSHTLVTTTCFRVFVQSGICPGVYTPEIIVNANPQSQGGTISAQNGTICSGQNAGTLTLAGQVGTIIRWERSTNCPAFSSPTTINNTTTTLAAGTLTTTTCYRAVVRSANCPSANSNIITITVAQQTVPGTVSAAQTICPGAVANNLTLTGNTGNVIRWESAVNCSPFGAPITTIAETTTSLNISGITSTTCFRAVVQNGTCNPANTNAVTIIVSPTPVPGTVSASQTICGNQTVSALNLSGHSGGSVIRWESSTDCQNFTSPTTINNTTTTYTPPTPLTTTCFRAVLRNANNCTANSQPATITVAVATVPGTLASAQTVCNGQAVQTLNLTGNTGNPVRWEKSEGCTNTWTSITHTLTNYSPGVITTTTCYRVVVSNQGCPPQNSNSIQITVTQNVQPGAVTGGNTICPNQNSALLTLSGHQGTVVRWERSTDCPDFVNNVTTISNTQTTFTATGLTTTTCFRAVIQSGNCGQINSQPTTVTVTQTVAGAVSQNQILCQVNNSGTLTLSGQQGNVVRWESSPDCGTFTPLTTINNQTTTHNFSNLTQSTCFRAVVQNANCPTQNSAFALVSLDAPSVAGTINGSSSICSGTDAGNLTLTGFNRDILGWESSTDCPNFTNPTDIPVHTATLAVGSLNQTTCYRARVQNGICPAETTAVFTIHVDQPPVPGQLNSVTVCRNTPATITLTGQTGTIVRWEGATNCNDFANGTPINNTTATLTIPNATQNSCFRLMVRNGACPPEPSGTGTITVDTPPVGGTLSSNVTACTGQNTNTLTINGFTGQIAEWQFSNDCPNFTNPQTIQGETGISYTPPPVNQTTCYRVKVHSGVCPDVFSSIATITVENPTIAGNLSGNATICSGNASGTMTLTGNNGTVVRWEKSTDCPGFSNPVTITNVTTTHNEAGIIATTCFRAVVKNGSCPEANSNIVTITVDPSTSAGTVNTNQNICFNTQPQALVLQNFLGTIVRWESSTDCANNTFNSPTQIPNTTPNYTPPTLQSTTCYRAIVQSGNCSPAPSALATIMVYPQAVGGQVGTQTTVCVGGTPPQLNLSGQTGSILRWEYSTNCTPFTAQSVIQSTTNFIQPPAITQPTCYRAIVRSGDNCPEVPSSPVTIFTQNPSVGGTVTADQTLCVQNNGASFTLVGEMGDIIRWESSTDCINFTAPVDLQNAGSQTLNVPVVFQTSCFRAIVQNGFCPPAPSVAAKVTIDQMPLAGTLSADQTICLGGAVQPLELFAYTGRIEWWCESPDNFATETIIPNTNPTYTPINTTTRYYRVRINNGVCPSVFSNVVKITVDNQTIAGTIAQSATVCQESNSGTLTLSGHQGNVLRWETATNCTDPLNPVGLATVSNLTTSQTYTNLQQTTCYRAWVQSGSCNPASTPFVTITVVPITVGGTVTPDNTVCFGASSGTLTLTGKNGNVLRWESATDINFTQNLATINNQTTSYESVTNTQTRYFRAVVKNGICPEKTSAPVLITVRPSPNPGQVTQNQTICTGTAPNEFTLINAQNATILRWQSSTQNFAQGQPITDHAVTIDRFTSGVLTQNTCFRAVVAAAQGCDEIFSQPACVIVDPQTVAGTIGNSQTLCSNNANGTITLTGHTGTILGWESATQADFSNSISVQNSQGQTSINYNALTTTTYYRARVKSGVCPEQTTNTVTIQVDQDVTQPNAGTNQTICADNFNLTASAIQPAIATGLWTVVSGAGTFANATSPTTTVTNIGIGANVYRWTVRNGVCLPKSADITITRDQVPTVSNAGNNETICESQTSYTLKANNGVIPAVGTGVWTKTGPGTGVITPTNNPTATVTGMSVGTNEFTYTITNGNVCAPSVSKVTITVNANTLSGTASADRTVCFGQNNGTLQLTGSRGNILRWESVEVVGNGTVTTINNTTTALAYLNLTRSTRFRAVVQNPPCLPITSNEVTITVDPATVAGTVNSSTIVCRDGNNGVLTLMGHVGNILRWEVSENASFSPRTDVPPSLNTITFNNLTVTTYYRAIVQSGVCGALPSVPATIEVRKPTVTLQTTNIRCFGNTDGAIDITANGGVKFDIGQPYRYNWTLDGQFFNDTEDLNNLKTGQYCVTITDAIGCTVTACTTVTQPTLLVAQMTERKDLSCFEANDGVIKINVSGGINNPPYTYRWTRNNADFSVSKDLTGLSAGTYAVTVTDGNGCSTAIGPFTLTQPEAIISTTSYIKDVTCNGLSNGAIGHHVTGGSPPYTFLWSNGATTEDIEILKAGTYTITVTDMIGCKLIKPFTVKEPPVLTVRLNEIQNVACYGGNNGAIGVDVMGGTPPYLAYWSNGSRTEDLSNVAAGVYEITVRDAKGCIVRQTYTVGQPEPMIANFTVIRPVSCGGGATGAVRVSVSGGKIPYTYLWNNGSITDSISNVPAGGYSVSVKDAKGCLQTFTYNLGEPNPIQIIDEQITNVKCKGTATGAIALTVTGGNANYTYQWSNGATKEDLFNLVAGTYTITITDGHSCALSKTFTIKEPAEALTVTLNNLMPLTCNGKMGASIDVLVNGGWYPYTYKWSNEETTEDLFNITAGQYVLEVTDAGGCSVTFNQTIENPTPINVELTFAKNPSCTNFTDGAIAYQITGGKPPYTYQWAHGATTEDVNNLSAGTYTLTITDALGCTAVTSQTLTNPTPIVIQLLTTKSASCADTPDGGLTVQVSGGVAPYTHIWSNGSTNLNLTNAKGGQYILTTTDSKGCTQNATMIVPSPQPLVLKNILKKDVSCNMGRDGALAVMVTGGASPYTLVWKQGSIVLGNGMSLTGLSAGTYTLEITDKNGCKATYSETLSAPELLTVNPQITPVRCFGEFNGEITLDVNGGTKPYTYKWSTGSTQSKITQAGAGFYSVTITDAKGCFNVQNLSLTSPEALAITLAGKQDIACKGQNTGSITVMVVGGSPEYTFLWSNGSTNQNLVNIGAGVYSLTVTNHNGCTQKMNNIRLSEPSAVLNTRLSYKKNSACASTPTGEIAVDVTGGTPPYIYAWSNGTTTEDLMGISGGTYTLTATDAKNCIFIFTETIEEPKNPLTVKTDVIKSLTCNGGNDGEILVNVSGGTQPYSYLWTNGSINEDVRGLSAGFYTLTVRDANGCLNISSYEITQANPVRIVADEITPSGCVGSGKISVSVSGGEEPYTYLWSDGSMNRNLTNALGGSYQLLVIDGLGCKTVQSFEIPTVQSLTGSIQLSKPPTCSDSKNGILDLTVAGGTPPYTFTWNNGATTEDISNAEGGNNGVVIKDNAGCVLQLNYNVPTVAPIVLKAGIVLHPRCAGMNNGYIGVIVSGGVLPYQFIWSNGAKTKDITGLTAGIYTLTLTDANGCQTEFTQELIVPNVLEINNSQLKTPTCNGLANGQISVEVSGGKTPYRYKWSNNSTNATLTNVKAGNYSLTVTDDNGCGAVKSFTLTEPKALIASIASITPANCNGGSNGGADIQVSGGTKPYTYTWSNNATTEDLAGVKTGNYTLTVKDANNCSTTLNVTIPNASTVQTQITLSNNKPCVNTSSVTLTATPAGGNFSGTGVTGNTFNPSVAGVGKHTITYFGTMSGCAFTGTKTIEVFALPNDAQMKFAGKIVGDHDFCRTDTRDYLITPSPIQSNISVTITGNGVRKSGNSFVFRPSNAGSGAHTLKMTLTDLTTGCSREVVTTVQVGNPPLVVASAGNTAICTGSSTTLSATGADRYEWTPVIGLSSTTGATVQASPETTTTYTVTGFSAGCQTTSTVRIQVTNAPAITLINQPSGNVCTGTPIQITAFSSGNYTYVWNPAVNVSSPSGNIVTILPQATTIYTVTGVNPQGCTRTATIQITVQSPGFTLVSTQNEICGGGSAMINVNGDQNAIYNWSPSTGLNTNTGTSVIATPTQTTTYTVTRAGSSAGCNTQAITINVKAGVNAQILNLNDQYCVGSPAVNLQGQPSGGTFKIDGMPNTNFVPSLLKLGTHEVSYEGTSGECSYIVRKTVTITAQSSAQLLGLKPIYCLIGASDIITAIPSGGQLTGAGINGNRFEPSLAGVGIHTIRYAGVETNGCSYDVSVTVEVRSTAVTINAPTTVCQNMAPVALTGVPAGGTFSGTGINNNTFNPSTAGFGTHMITYSGIDGPCTYSKTIAVQVLGAITVTPSVNNAGCATCANGSISVNVSGGQPPYTYQLNNNPQQQTSTFTGLTAGSYNVSITDALGCSSTVQAIVASTGNQSNCQSTTDLTLTNVTRNSATVNWNIVNGASGYVISWRKVGFNEPWRTTNSANNSFTIVNLLGDTEYEVRVRVRCGNELSEPKLIQFRTTAGRESISQNEPNSVSVYPNPNKGHFSLTFPFQLNESVKLQLFDLNGKLITEQTIIPSSESVEVSFSNISSGMYLLQLPSSLHIAPIKLVIE